jgi:hypothetical protein
LEERSWRSLADSYYNWLCAAVFGVSLIVSASAVYQHQFPGASVVLEHDEASSVYRTNGNNDTQLESNENDDAVVSNAKTTQVAWIMSFGGSGTSYTIVNTE